MKSSELVARGTAWPDVGISAVADTAIFATPQGGVTGPVATDGGTAIIHVLERQATKPEDLASGRDALRQEIENDRRSKFFSAYMTKARDRMKVEVNPDVLRAITG